MANLGIHEKAEATAAARTDYLPKLIGNVTYLHFNSNLGTVETLRTGRLGILPPASRTVAVTAVNQDSSLAAITLVQPITKLIAVHAAVKIAKADEQIAQAQLAQGTRAAPVRRRPGVLRPARGPAHRGRARPSGGLCSAARPVKPVSRDPRRGDRGEAGDEPGTGSVGRDRRAAQQPGRLPRRHPARSGGAPAPRRRSIRQTRPPARPLHATRRSRRRWPPPERRPRHSRLPGPTSCRTSMSSGPTSTRLAQRHPVQLRGLRHLGLVRLRRLGQAQARQAPAQNFKLPRPRRTSRRRWRKSCSRRTAYGSFEQANEALGLASEMVDARRSAEGERRTPARSRPPRPQRQRPSWSTCMRRRTTAWPMPSCWKSSGLSNRRPVREFKHFLPIRLHVHHDPSVRGGVDEGLVQAADG